MPRRYIGDHPQIVGIAMVALAATLLRAAFLFRAPVFVTGDSESYLGPAFELARGLGFDLSLKRTPGYPGFIALIIAVCGEDMRALVFAQHVLGVLTATLAYVLGRLTFGFAVGLAAGLLTAVNGALVLAEHTVMTEALFVPLVIGALTALVAALRSSRAWLYILAGILLGVATLTRPVAQVLVPMIPMAILLVTRSWRSTVVPSAVFVGAFAAVVLPWVLWSVAEQDTATVGSLGQTLVGRTARHDRAAFTYYDPATDGEESDARRSAARRILQDAANRGSSGKAVHTRLRRELQLSAAEADRLMRDLAIEAILRQPGYYVQGTLQRFWRLSLGSVERLGAYRNTSDVARERWEHAATRHLLVATTPSEERQAPVAAALISGYQPGYLGVIVPLSALVGLAAAIVRRELRPALVLGFAAFALLFTSAALVGNVSRYRFPADPLLAVLAMGGLMVLASRLQLTAQQWAGRQRWGSRYRPPRRAVP